MLSTRYDSPHLHIFIQILYLVNWWLMVFWCGIGSIQLVQLTTRPSSRKPRSTWTWSRCTGAFFPITWFRCLRTGVWWRKMRETLLASCLSWWSLVCRCLALWVHFPPLVCLLRKCMKMKWPLLFTCWENVGKWNEIGKIKGLNVSTFLVFKQKMGESLLTTNIAMTKQCLIWLIKTF